MNRKSHSLRPAGFVQTEQIKNKWEFWLSRIQAWDFPRDFGRNRDVSAQYSAEAKPLWLSLVHFIATRLPRSFSLAQGLASVRHFAIQLMVYAVILLMVGSFTINGVEHLFGKLQAEMTSMGFEMAKVATPETLKVATFRSSQE